ncbi:hypothetical protein Lqui_1347 [Legionella quinlivanii]|uniref:Ankyrin repeat protein n=1 Tax=Legionella quinlivanii TaxID=45073 RepID=A0A0W0Y051_9GAMM|nr:hypothetical protein [Legionella quinlivanii]KTD50022.1 hypothetical protein Lqui_1347 [Legionella quinlivanii]SEF94382.1 hypothetical protein SAMN02746093_01449 [Legionella quinlivanii DSM 21216]STY11202.1 Uncharacterised protein [Legionella quinlivanii]
MTHGEFLDWLDELDRLNPEKPKLAVLIERLKGEAYNLNQDQVIADIQALLNQISTFDESIVYPRAHPVGRVLNTFIRGSETALFFSTRTAVTAIQRVLDALPSDSSPESIQKFYTRVMDWTQFAPKDGENVLSEEEQAYIKAYFKNRATESVKQTLTTIYSVNDKVSKRAAHERYISATASNVNTAISNLYDYVLEPNERISPVRSLSQQELARATTQISTTSLIFYAHKLSLIDGHQREVNQLRKKAEIVRDLTGGGYRNPKDVNRFLDLLVAIPDEHTSFMYYIKSYKKAIHNFSETNVFAQELAGKEINHLIDRSLKYFEQPQTKENAKKFIEQATLEISDIYSAFQLHSKQTFSTLASDKITVLLQLERHTTNFIRMLFALQYTIDESDDPAMRQRIFDIILDAGVAYHNDIENRWSTDTLAVCLAIIGVETLKTPEDAQQLINFASRIKPLLKLQEESSELVPQLFKLQQQIDSNNSPHEKQRQQAIFDVILETSVAYLSNAKTQCSRDFFEYYIEQCGIENFKTAEQARRFMTFASAVNKDATPLFKELADFHLKVINMEKKNPAVYQSAVDTATKLLFDLMERSTKFLSNPKTKQGCKDYEHDCQEIINAALPVLKEHRGAKNVLAWAALVMSVGIIPLVVATFNKLFHGEFTFFPQTATEKKVDALKAAVHVASEPPEEEPEETDSSEPLNKIP